MCVRVCVCVFISVYVCVPTQMCTQAFMRMCLCASKINNRFVCVRVCVRVRVHACVCVRVPAKGSDIGGAMARGDSRVMSAKYLYICTRICVKFMCMRTYVHECIM